MKRFCACLLSALLLGAPLRAQGFLKGKILYFDAGDNLSERSGSRFKFSLTGGLLRALRRLRQVPARLGPAVPRTRAYDVHLDGGRLPDDILIESLWDCHLRKPNSADFFYLCKLLKR